MKIKWRRHEHDSSRAKLCRLLYISKVGLGHPDGGAAEHVAIAAQSAERNATNGVTGCLLLVDDQFIQLLEGSAAMVEQTFERICRDFRHRELQLIDMVSVKERLFGDWNMACIGRNCQVRMAMRDEMEEIRFMAGVNAAQAAQQMRTLLDRELVLAM